jgi:hypothetical protein
MPNGPLQIFERFIRRGIPVRRLGSAAIDLCWVAAGRFDGFYEMNLQPWDSAADFSLLRKLVVALPILRQTLFTSSNFCGGHQWSDPRGIVGLDRRKSTGITKINCMDSRTEIASLGEFGLINHLTRNIELKHASSIVGVGDRCCGY